jgi:hypothetical protein
VLLAEAKATKTAPAATLNLRCRRHRFICFMVDALDLFLLVMIIVYQCKIDLIELRSVHPPLLIEEKISQ